MQSDNTEFERWKARNLDYCSDPERFVPRGGGDSHMEWTGMLVGNFEFIP